MNGLALQMPEALRRHPPHAPVGTYELGFSNLIPSSM